MRNDKKHILIAILVFGCVLLGQLSVAFADKNEHLVCVQMAQHGGVQRVAGVSLKDLERRLSVLETPPDLSVNFDQVHVVSLAQSLKQLGYDDNGYNLSTGICWAYYSQVYAKDLVGEKKTALFNSNIFAPSKDKPVSGDRGSEHAAYVKLALLKQNRVSKLAPELKIEDVEAAIMKSRFAFHTDKKVTELIFKDGVYWLPQDMLLVNQNDALIPMLLKAIRKSLSSTASIPDAPKTAAASLLTFEKRAQCVTKALGHSITRIGNIDLAVLKEQIRNLKVDFTDELPAASGGLRRSAVNWPGSLQFQIKTPSVSDLNLSWEVILLHESLGALGYDDENFLWSTAICRAAWYGGEKGGTDWNSVLQKLVGGEIKKIDKLREYPTYSWERGPGGKLMLKSGGGVTSTGGGGDGFASSLKFDMLIENDAMAELMRNPEMAGKGSLYRKFTKEQIETAILEMQIEQFNDHPEVSEIQVTVKEDGKRIYWVPRGRYLKNSAGALETTYTLLFYRLLRDLKEDLFL